MSLDGGKLIQLDADGVRGEEFKAKGRKFAVGYYMSCDLILGDRDKRVKGVHCEIKCDAFGRVTVHNFSDEHPILVNDHIVSDKRPLYNGTRLKILEKDYVWEFPKTVSSEGEELNTVEPVTPTSQIGLQQPLPNSCPDIKNKVHLDNRLTFHNFAYSIHSNEEGNKSSDSNEDPNDNVSTTDKQTETMSQQQHSHDGTESIQHRCRTPEKKDAMDTTADTPKVNLLDATKNKENSSSLKKQNLLSYCKQSDIAITSYSPRTAGVCIERSFTKLIKPSGNTSTSQTPKSVYSTPQSAVGGVLVELNDDSVSRDFMDFSTPTSSRKLIKEPNKSMHLIDLTTPSRFRPILKGELTNSSKRNYSLPTQNIGSCDSKKSSGSIISVDSSSPSIIDVGSSSSINSPASSSRNLQHKTPRKFVCATPKRTPQSLMKRALLTSAKKQVMSRLKMTSPLTPKNASARELLLATRRQSLTTPTSKAKALTDSAHKDDQLVRRLQLTASSVSRKLPTSTPVSSVGTLRHRDSLTASSSNYHSPRMLPRVPLSLTKRISPTSVSSKLVAKARKSLCSPQLSPTSIRARALTYAATKSAASLLKRNDANVRQLSRKTLTPTTESLRKDVQNDKNQLKKLITPAKSEEETSPGDLRKSLIENSVDDGIAVTSQMHSRKDVSSSSIQTKQVDLTCENLQTDCKLTEKSDEASVTDNDTQQNELSQTFLIEDSSDEDVPKTSQKQTILNVTFSPEPAKRDENPSDNQDRSTEEDSNGATELLLSKIDQVLNKSDELVMSMSDTDEALDEQNTESKATELNFSTAESDSVELKDTECIASESNESSKVNESLQLKPDTETSKGAKGDEQLNDIESTTTVEIDEKNPKATETEYVGKANESFTVVSDVGTCIAATSTTIEETAEAANGADKLEETVELETLLNETRESMANVETECADREVVSLNLQQSRESHINDDEVQPAQEVESSIQVDNNIGKSNVDKVEFSRVESDSQTTGDERTSESLNGTNLNKDKKVENEVFHVDNSDPKMNSDIVNSSDIKEANQFQQENAADALHTEKQVTDSLEVEDEAKTSDDLKDNLEAKEVPAEFAKSEETDISQSLGDTTTQAMLLEIKTSAIEVNEIQHVEVSSADNVLKMPVEQDIPIEQEPKTPRRSMRLSSLTITNTVESIISEEKSTVFTPRRSLRRASLSTENNQPLVTPTRTAKRRSSYSTVDSTQTTPRSNAKRRQSSDIRLPTVTSTPISAKTTRKVLLMDETIGDMAVIVEEDDSELPKTTETKVPTPGKTTTSPSQVTTKVCTEVIEESICEEVIEKIDASKQSDLQTFISIKEQQARDESFCQAAELEATSLKSPAKETKETQLEATSPNLDIHSGVSKTPVPAKEDYGCEVMPTLPITAVELENFKCNDSSITSCANTSQVETAVDSNQIDFVGMRELLKTPKSCSTPCLKGVRELLKTPKISATPILGGLKEMILTPSDTKGANSFNITLNRAAEERLTERNLNQSEDDEGLDKFFKTPRAKNVMIPNDPASAVLQKHEESDTLDHEHVTVYDLNSTNSSMQLGKLFETPVPSRFSSRLQDDEVDVVESHELSLEKSKSSNEKTISLLSETPKRNLSAEEAFDDLVGLPSSFQSPVEKVYQRKSVSSTVTSSHFSDRRDVTNDLPKTDIQEWVDSLEDTPVENITENEVTMASVTLKTEDPLSLSNLGISIIKDKSDQEESPKSSMKVFVLANDTSNVTNASEKLINVSTVSTSRDPLTSTTFKSSYEATEETDECKPTTSSDANMSGIQLLDETTESIMEPLLISCNDSLNATLEETTPAYMLKDKAENQTDDQLLDDEKTCTNDLEEPLVVSEDDPDEIADYDKTEILTNITSEPSLEVTDSNKEQVKVDLTTTDVDISSNELTLDVANDTDKTEAAATTIQQPDDASETNRHRYSTSGANVSAAKKESDEMIEKAETSKQNFALPNQAISSESALPKVTVNNEDVKDEDTSKSLDTIRTDNDENEDNLASAVVEENNLSDQKLSKSSEIKESDKQIGDNVNITKNEDDQSVENINKTTMLDLNESAAELNKSPEVKRSIEHNDLKMIETVVIADDEVDSDSNEAKTATLIESIEILESDDDNVEEETPTSKIVESSEMKTEEKIVEHETKKTLNRESSTSTTESNKSETDEQMTTPQTANIHSIVDLVESSEAVVEINETEKTKISTEREIPEQVSNIVESTTSIANCEVNSENASGEAVMVSVIGSPVVEKVGTLDNKEADRCIVADNVENVESLSKTIIETPSETSEVVEMDNVLHNKNPIAVELELGHEIEPIVDQLNTNLDEIESNCSVQAYTENAIETICLDDSSNDTSVSFKNAPVCTIDLGTSSSAEAILVINNSDSEELTTDSGTSIKINKQAQIQDTVAKETVKYNKELSHIEASEEENHTIAFEPASATPRVNTQATSQLETEATAPDENPPISEMETQAAAEVTTQVSADVDMQATEGGNMKETVEEAATVSETISKNIEKDSEEAIAKELLKAEEILPEKVSKETRSNYEEALFEATNSKAHENVAKEEMEAKLEIVIDSNDIDSTIQDKQPKTNLEPKDAFVLNEVVEPPSEDKQLNSSLLQNDLVGMTLDISKKTNSCKVVNLESNAIHTEIEVTSSLSETSESVELTEGSRGAVIQPEKIGELRRTDETTTIQQPIILTPKVNEQKLNITSSKRRRKSFVEVDVQEPLSTLKERPRRRGRIPSTQMDDAEEVIEETPAKSQEGKRHRRRDRVPSEEPTSNNRTKELNVLEHKNPLRKARLASVTLEPISKVKEDLKGSLALAVEPISGVQKQVTEKPELHEVKILVPSVSARTLSNIDIPKGSPAILDKSEDKQPMSAANAETIADKKTQAVSTSFTDKPTISLLQDNTIVSSALERDEEKVQASEEVEKQSAVDKNVKDTLSNTSESERIKSTRRGRKLPQTVEEDSEREQKNSEEKSPVKLVEMKSTRRGRKPSASAISDKVNTEMLAEEKEKPTSHKRTQRTGRKIPATKVSGEIEQKELSELAVSTTSAIANNSVLLHDENIARSDLINSKATETGMITHSTNNVHEATAKRTTKRIHEQSSVVDPLIKLAELPRTDLNIHGTSTSSSIEEETSAKDAKDITHKKPITRRGRKKSAFKEMDDLSKADSVVDSQPRKIMHRGRTPTSAVIAIEEKQQVTDKVETQKITLKSSAVSGVEVAENASADTKLAKRTRKVLKATIKVVDDEKFVADVSPADSEKHEVEQPKPVRKGRRQGKSPAQLKQAKENVPQVPTNENQLADNEEIVITPTTTKPVDLEKDEVERSLTPGASSSSRKSRKIPKWNYDETSDDEAHPTKSASGSRVARMARKAIKTSMEVKSEPQHELPIAVETKEVVLIKSLSPSPNADQTEAGNEDEIVSPKREGRNLPRRNYDETSDDEKTGASIRSRRARKPTSKILQMEAERAATPKRQKVQVTDAIETPHQPSSSRRVRGGRKIQITSTTDSNEELPLKREATEPSVFQQPTTTTGSSGGDVRDSGENEVLVATKAVSRSRRKPARAQPEAKDLTDTGNGEVKTSARSRVIKRKAKPELSEETELEPAVKKSPVALTNTTSRTKRAAVTKNGPDTDVNENEKDENIHAPASVVEEAEAKVKPAAKATIKRGVQTKTKAAAMQGDDIEEDSEPQAKKAAREPKSSRTRATAKAKKDVDSDEDTVAHIPAVKPRGRGRKASADLAPKAVGEEQQSAATSAAAVVGAAGIKSSLRARGKQEVAIAIIVSSDEHDDDNESMSSTSVKGKTKKRVRGKPKVVAVEAAQKPEPIVSEQESPPAKSARRVRGRKVHFQATESEKTPIEEAVSQTPPKRTTRARRK